MSLSRQILLLIAVLYGAVFVGNFYLTLDNTRRYAASQLETHAQDTATSLGLSLSPHLASGDTLLMESMVDAIFDRGYFRRIAVVDTAGQPLITREVDVVVAGVPSWFMDWLDFRVPPGDAVVMAGWQPGGAVKVVSHPGFAYEELWGSAVETLGWSVVTLLLALAVTVVGVRLALRPLGDLEAAAMAVSERDFRLIERIPAARELRRVVQAMNQMTIKVEAMVTEQHTATQRQLADAYVDPVTLLGNRAAFERELGRMVAREEESLFGSVLLVQLAGLDDLNRNAGYQRGDAMLRAGGSALARSAAREQGFAARLGGGLFGMVLPGSARADQEDLLERVRSEVRDAMLAEGYAERVVTGAAYYGGSQDAGTLMKRAQDALQMTRKALDEAEDPQPVRLHDATEVGAGLGSAQQASWLAILDGVLERQAIRLRFQRAVSLDDRTTLHEEVLARLDTGGERLVEPGMFAPMAARVGMSAALDRAIIEVSLGALARQSGTPLAINLAQASVLDAAFREWLGSRLASFEFASSLTFEVQERVFMRAPAQVLEFSAALRASGARIALDRCGADSIDLEHQRALRAAYHKIDGQFIRGVDSQAQAARYVESMVRMRHGLDVLVIAERVESEEEVLALTELGVDGAQGFFLSAPEERDA